MSHPQHPQRQPTPSETANYAKAVHNTAVLTLVACPVLALLPPRKLDLFTLGLAGGTAFSASFLIREQTGRTVLQHLSGQRPEQVVAASPAVHAVQETLRQERQESLRAVKDERPSIADEIAASREQKGWVKERDAEVKEALEEGKGLGDMIMDQVWDVWNWGKKKEEDEE